MIWEDGKELSVLIPAEHGPAAERLRAHPLTCVTILSAFSGCCALVHASRFENPSPSHGVFIEN